MTARLFECAECGYRNEVPETEIDEALMSAAFYSAPYILRCDGCDNGIAEVTKTGSVVPV